jgi:3'-phosphoadenosine 5'-phosphosulfate sulfotransferase (PAPS reductase)/FAD synthetase
VARHRMPVDMTLTTISYGGGVQSTAMLVLAAQGKLGYDVDAALFANVGDDSEHPATLDYVRNVAKPWADEQGVPVHILDRVKRDGTTETLMGRLMKPGSRSLPIPIRMSNGAPGNRSCTSDFKIKVVEGKRRE